MLDQGHLCPGTSNVPIYWNYDHALRLYPLPDTLILGGSNCQEFHEIYHDVDIIHPGTFGKNGTYAATNNNRHNSVTTAKMPNYDDYDSDDDIDNGNLDGDDHHPSVHFHNVKHALNDDERK